MITLIYILYKIDVSRVKSRCKIATYYSNSSKKDTLESVKTVKTNTSRTLIEYIITLVISWRPI